MIARLLPCVTAFALAGALAGLPSGPAAAAPPSHAADGHRAVPGEILVGYDAGASASDRARARGRAGAELVETVVAGDIDTTVVELVRVPPSTDRSQAQRDIAADPVVAFSEPNYVVTKDATGVSTDPYLTDGKLWGMKGGFGSNAESAWATTSTGSASVYVGVIDEGIQFTHPDLAGQVWTNPFDAADGADNDGNGYVDDIHGWDFAGNNNTIYDGGNKGTQDDHGTHVSGTIGAKADGRGVVGVNWNVTMISGKFLGRTGGTLANAVKAVDYFTNLKTRHGLNIVATNNSWGGGGFSQSLFDAISRANAANILFVAAAGNDGLSNDSTLRYPSSYNVANVIAVAAIDVNGALASFSNFGAAQVDLGAPGVGVWSTTAKDTYSSYNGTSMAAPHVTGAVALYAAAKPGSSAAQIKNAILTGATPTGSLAGKTLTGGRLDIPVTLTK